MVRPYFVVKVGGGIRLGKQSRSGGGPAREIEGI